MVVQPREQLWAIEPAVQPSHLEQSQQFPETDQQLESSFPLQNQQQSTQQKKNTQKRSHQNIKVPLQVPKTLSFYQQDREANLKSNHSSESPKKSESKEPFIFATPAKRAPSSQLTMVEWKNTFNMRPVMISTLKARRNGIRGSPSGRLSLNRASHCSSQPAGAARSLDLLRTNLQAAINRDIQQVLNKYLERFFQPAMENIRVNLGRESIVEDHVRSVCQRVLEEAKQMYSPSNKSHGHKKHHKHHKSKSYALEKQSLKSNYQENQTNENIPREIRSDNRKAEFAPLFRSNSVQFPIQSCAKTQLKMQLTNKTQLKLQPVQVNTNYKQQPMQLKLEQVRNGAVLQTSTHGTQVKLCPVVPLQTPAGNLQQLYRKRKEMESEMEEGHKKRRLITPVTVTVSNASSATPLTISNRGTVVSPTIGIPSGLSSRFTSVAAVNCKSSPSSSTASSVSINYQSSKWDPARITADTLFVMGARANKVLGYGQTRGRLYAKHHDLFKYSGDQEDKEWLTKNSLMPPTGGKAFLMIMQDIHELALSNEYRNNPNLSLHELKGFRAPEFLLRKIRAFMRNLRTEPLDDLSGLLDMELLPEFCDKESSLNLGSTSTPSRELLDSGVNHMDDSLMELALEYGMTLMNEPGDEASTPSPQPSVPSSTPTTLSSTSMLTTLPPSLEALAPRSTSTSTTLCTSTSSTPTTPSSTPTSPNRSPQSAKVLSRSLSLPATVALSSNTGTPTFNADQALIELPLTATLEELEMLIKTESTSDTRAPHRAENTILDSIDPQEDVFDHIMRADVTGDVNIDSNLDANLDASLDANLDLNLDVNLDVNLDTEPTALEIAYLGLMLDEEGSNGELNTSTHRPISQEYQQTATTESPINSGNENSLAMSHATLTALLSGNTLDGLEIPDALL